MAGGRRFPGVQQFSRPRTGLVVGLAIAGVLLAGIALVLPLMGTPAEVPRAAQAYVVRNEAAESLRFTVHLGEEDLMLGEGTVAPGGTWVLPGTAASTVLRVQVEGADGFARARCVDTRGDGMALVLRGDPLRIECARRPPASG